nr:MAG TPA: hypothetical protein [Caudoviricetes sp.]
MFLNRVQDLLHEDGIKICRLLSLQNLYNHFLFYFKIKYL